MWHEYKINEQIRITGFYSFFEAYRPVNYSFSGESHNFWECMYVINGQICASGNERVYHLKSNDMIVHKPLELHKYNVEGTNEASLLIFSFNVKGSITDFFKDKVFHLSLSQQRIINNLLDYVRTKPQKDEKYPAVLSYLSPSNQINTYLQNLSSGVEQIFLSLYEESVPTSVSNSHDAVIFGNAVKYMLANINTQISIDTLSRHCNISSTGLKKIFTKYSGLGIHQYFLKLKMNKASEYLKTGLSVTEISSLLGFSSQGYFSHAFKRETGLSPSEYLR